MVRRTLKENMVKKIEEKVKELVEGKKQNLHITFNNYAREDAELALIKRGLPVRENFDGPIFEDISGYSVNGDWVAVMTKDGATYIYPANSVARIKHFTAE